MPKRTGPGASIVIPEDLTIGAPERTPDGALTHKGMRQVLARGGSVVHKGQHIGSLQELPDQIILEGNSDEALDSLEEDLDKQQAELEAKRVKIDRKRKKLAKGEPEPEEEKVVEDEDEDLSTLSKDDLKKKAKDKGIEVTDDMKKADLIAALEA